MPIKDLVTLLWTMYVLEQSVGYVSRTKRDVNEYILVSVDFGMSSGKVKFCRSLIFRRASKLVGTFSVLVLSDEMYKECCLCSLLIDCSAEILGRTC